MEPRIEFESPHFPLSDRAAGALRRALSRMPNARYSRGATHVPEFFKAVDGDDTPFEQRSIDVFKQCRDRHETESMRWWSADEMAHAFGWGDWDRETPTGMYHAFFCGHGESPAIVRDFVLEAYPRRSVHVVARAEALKRYRIPLEFLRAMCTPSERRTIAGIMRSLRMHEYDPEEEIAAMMAIRRDWPSILILDGILDAPQVCQNLAVLLRQPMVFVFVFRGPGAIRDAVERERGASPLHVPLQPTDDELQELVDRDRRASNAAAGTSYD